MKAASSPQDSPPTLSWAHPSNEPKWSETHLLHLPPAPHPHLWFRTLSSSSAGSASPACLHLHRFTEIAARNSTVFCMTSASELFHSRRYRVGRNVESELASALDRNLHLHGTHRYHGRDYHHQHRIRPEDDSDPLRRPRLHTRHLCHRLSQTERESIRMGLGPSGNSETSSGRANNPRFTRNNQLPGTVLQARTRLLERLRGLTANREINTASGFPWHEFPMNDGLRLVDGETTVVWERETPRQGLAPALYITNSVFQAEQSSYQTHLSQKKPPGLSWAAFRTLPREVFHTAKVDGDAEECSICLERFWEGDGLICLPCGHRFHPLCLDPWVRACGDCPYCRTAVVDNCGESKR